MFYIIENQYVGPHSREAAYVDASTVEIRTTPAVKNGSRAVCVDGWCGTTGDWSIYAHGEYATLEAARNAIAEKFGDMRAAEPDDDDVVAVYKLGKYVPISAEDSVGYAWDGIAADINADTTDEEINALLVSYEEIANEDGITLDADAIRDAMEEHRRHSSNNQPAAPRDAAIERSKSMNNPSPEEIRAAREATGLTQTQAARLVHRSLRAWQEWEAGRFKMPQGLFELFQCRTQLFTELGFTADEAKRLRRISRDLHRWHEMECGTGTGSIERDESGRPFWRSVTGELSPITDRGGQREKAACRDHGRPS